MRRAGGLVVIALVALVTAACVPPLSTKGDTASIQFVSTRNLNGWTYDYYRNNAYPCSVSGYQTFVIGTRIGSASNTPAPLWTHMHGGGVGYFDDAGNPVPNQNQKVEESAVSLDTLLDNDGLMQRIRNDEAGFRTLAVSYCSHEIYGGVNTPDPHNPNTTPDGKKRPTTGILATKAAIQFAQSLYPTTKTFLHGGSAGAAGAYYMAWAMQLQGIPPAGVVADASVVNREGMQAGYDAGICTDGNDPDRSAAVSARVHPDIAKIENEVDELVASGRLTVPLLHVWNHGDRNTCGSAPVSCPMRDGSTVTLGYTDCLHEPLKQAIADQGPTSRSMNLPLCVDSDAVPDCDVHVVTNKSGLVNTDPSSPPNYLVTVMTWVRDRLADA